MVTEDGRRAHAHDFKIQRNFLLLRYIYKKRPATLLPDVWWAIQVVINIKVGTCFFSSLSHLAKDTHTPFYVISDEQKEERESGGQTRIHNRRWGERGIWNNCKSTDPTARLT